MKLEVFLFGWDLQNLNEIYETRCSYLVDIHPGEEIKWKGLGGGCSRAPKTYKEGTVSTVSLRTVTSMGLLSSISTAQYSFKEVCMNSASATGRCRALLHHFSFLICKHGSSDVSRMSAGLGEVPHKAFSWRFAVDANCCDHERETFSAFAVVTLTWREWTAEVFSPFTGAILEFPLNLIFTTYLCVWPGTCWHTGFIWP